SPRRRRRSGRAWSLRTLSEARILWKRTIQTPSAGPHCPRRRYCMAWRSCPKAIAATLCPERCERCSTRTSLITSSLLTAQRPALLRRSSLRVEQVIAPSAKSTLRSRRLLNPRGAWRPVATSDPGSPPRPTGPSRRALPWARRPGSVPSTTRRGFEGLVASAIHSLGRPHGGGCRQDVLGFGRACRVRGGRAHEGGGGAGRGFSASEHGRGGAALFFAGIPSARFLAGDVGRLLCGRRNPARRAQRDHPRLWRLRHPGRVRRRP